MDAIAAVFQRIQQALLELSCNQFPHGVMFKGRRSEMLNDGNFCLGKYDDLNFH